MDSDRSGFERHIERLKPASVQRIRSQSCGHSLFYIHIICGKCTDEESEAVRYIFSVWLEPADPVCESLVNLVIVLKICSVYDCVNVCDTLPNACNIMYECILI